MNKKSSPKASASDPSETSPNFLDIESRVFTIVGKDLYIGRFKVDEALRRALQDEAQVLEKSRLWEILNASVLNEAYHWSLDLSEDFELVQSAKMLKHWSTFMRKIIHRLAEKP